MPGVPVVEDEPLVRAFLLDGLEGVAATVACASDAQAASMMLVGEAAMISVPVTDPDLGAGPDGLAAAAAEARRRLPTSWVVRATGSPERFEGRPLQASERPFVGPYRLTGLAAEVRGPVEQATAGACLAPVVRPPLVPPAPLPPV